jgi:leucyl-tRNA synthetase
VTEDIEHFKYNTAIAKIMELTNVISIHKATDKDMLKKLALILAPFTPHMMEEVWTEELGMPFSIHKSAWPSYEATLTVNEVIPVVVQINGKVRAVLNLESGISKIEEEVIRMAQKNADVIKWLQDGKIEEVFFVPGKIINFVLATP